MTTTIRYTVFAIIVFAAGFVVGNLFDSGTTVIAQSGTAAARDDRLQ